MTAEPLAVGSRIEVTRGSWAGLRGTIVDCRSDGLEDAATAQGKGYAWTERYGVLLDGEPVPLTFMASALALVEARGTAPAVGRALL